MKANYYFNTAEVTKKLGLDKGGRVQKIIDTQIIKYLRETMPVDSHTMQRMTREIKPGEVKVDVPYAHYMNEGVLYVMPENGKGAFYSPTYGYWSKPNQKKVRTNTPLNYKGSPDRGAHFVERTINGHFDDILKAAKEGVNK